MNLALTAELHLGDANQAIALSGLERELLMSKQEIPLDYLNLRSQLGIYNQNNQEYKEWIARQEQTGLND